jgi:hypothetical protein
MFVDLGGSAQSILMLLRYHSFRRLVEQLLPLFFQLSVLLIGSAGSMLNCICLPPSRFANLPYLLYLIVIVLLEAETSD